jgi:cell division protein FtsI/penicillin-binding protein 2
LTDTRALRDFGAGQGSLTVAPLQMARGAAALAMGGEMPAPRIVSATQSSEGVWTPVGQLPAVRVLPAGVAGQILSAMSRDGGLAWHAGVGLSGPARLLWFVGLAPAEQPRYVVTILLESTDGTESDRGMIEMGRGLLNALTHSRNE